MPAEKVHQTNLEEIDFSSINHAFSKQSVHYDQQDATNPILLAWRKQVYEHVGHFLKPNSHILELNSGTGIDALHFIEQGHKIHCTDLSDGMIQQIHQKKQKLNVKSRLTFEKCSFDALNTIEGEFDYIFSNFGGLNCIDDLAKVTVHLPHLLKPGACVTWVIMPPVCLWEIAWLLKGHRKIAFRRFHKNGVMAHLEGEYFKTYYYSLSQIKQAFGKSFRLLKSEGLGALSPPPFEKQFSKKHPGFYQFLTELDKNVRNHFPFNRWADHIIVTFKKIT